MNKKFLIVICTALTAATMLSSNAVAMPESVYETTTVESKKIDEIANIIKEAYWQKHPEYYKEITEITDTIVNSDEFRKCFENEGVSAFKIVEDSIIDLYSSPFDDDELMQLNMTQSYSLTVPIINQLCYQPPSYTPIYTFCGPASALQALIGNGKLSPVPANMNSTKVYSVGVEMGSNSSGTYIGSLNSYIADYYYSGDTYKVKAFTIYTYSIAIEYIKYSLMHGAAPVIRVDHTDLLDYYGDLSQQHYITIAGINLTNETITVVDPHYNDEYRGYHIISFDTFDDIMEDNGWISVYTNDPNNGEYVYQY